MTRKLWMNEIPAATRAKISLTASTASSPALPDNSSQAMAGRSISPGGP